MHSLTILKNISPLVLCASVCLNISCKWRDIDLVCLYYILNYNDASFVSVPEVSLFPSVKLVLNVPYNPLYWDPKQNSVPCRNRKCKSLYNLNYVPFVKILMPLIFHWLYNKYTYSLPVILPKVIIPILQMRKWGSESRDQKEFTLNIHPCSGDYVEETTYSTTYIHPSRHSAVGSCGLKSLKWIVIYPTKHF